MRYFNTHSTASERMYTDVEKLGMYVFSIHIRCTLSTHPHTKYKQKHKKGQSAREKEKSRERVES